MATKKQSVSVAELGAKAAVKKRKAKLEVTADQGPEYEAKLKEAVAKNTDMRHVRGLPNSKANHRPTPNADIASSPRRNVTNTNPSPSTRFKPGQSGCPDAASRVAAEKARVTDAEERKRLAKEAGLTPLEFLMSVMCDAHEKLYVRMDAAKVAAPYFHRKMPIAIDNGAGGPVGVYTKEQLARLNLQELQALEALMLKLSDVPTLASVPANATSQDIIDAALKAAGERTE